MSGFKQILAVVDAGTTGEPALQRAVALAQTNDAELTVAEVLEWESSHVQAAGDSLAVDLSGALMRERTAQLESLVEPYRKHAAIRTRLLTGVPFLEIIREVLRSGNDLLIKVAETPDWLERLFGSDEMHLLRKCPCPVWLIKPGAPDSYRRILAAVDVDDAYPAEELQTRRLLNERILQVAAALASAESAELHVVHAWYAIGESVMRGVRVNADEVEIAAYVEQQRRRSRHSLEALLSATGVDPQGGTAGARKPHRHLLQGWARKEIPLLAKRIAADLLVMGTVGRTGVPGFIMGNTAETILNQIDCSVLAVKPPGFVTPVTLED